MSRAKQLIEAATKRTSTGRQRVNEGRHSAMLGSSFDAANGNFEMLEQEYDLESFFLGCAELGGAFEHLIKLASAEQLPRQATQVLEQIQQQLANLANMSDF